MRGILQDLQNLQAIQLGQLKIQEDQVGGPLLFLPCPTGMRKQVFKQIFAVADDVDVTINIGVREREAE
jgi:hypothetical protein